MERKIRRVLLKRCLNQYVPHWKLESCLDEVEAALDGHYDKRIPPEDDLRHLQDYGLSKRLLNGLNRASIYTIADLKLFMLKNECFQLTGQLGIRNVGKVSFEELLEKIPEIKAFCKEPYDNGEMHNNY